jgi:hypothetical protein
VPASQGFETRTLPLILLEQLTSFIVMNRIDPEKRAGIVRALVESNSVRATARLTNTAKATVLKLLVDVGELCSAYQHHTICDLKCRQVKADEIWAYAGAKEKNTKKESPGDIWTYTALCAESKLMVSWLVGRRNQENTQAFMADVAGRLANRVQLTTDGVSRYLSAVDDAFRWQGVDYAQIVKTHGLPLDESALQRPYSAMVSAGTVKSRVMGNPDLDNVSTSYVGLSDLSMRTGMRRFIRLTNGLGKKAENHAHAISLYFMHYNYCRPHQTLIKAANGIKTTPAMAAGIADHVWPIEEILGRMSPGYPLHSNPPITDWHY